MLFCRWRLRKFYAFFSKGAEKILFFCFSCFVVVVLLFCFVFFFPPEIQGLVVLRNLFLKSYTFACGWEELSVIVRVTFSYAFFFLSSIMLYSGRVVLSALGRPMCPGGKIGGKKL